MVLFLDMMLKPQKILTVALYLCDGDNRLFSDHSSSQPDDAVLLS